MSSFTEPLEYEFYTKENGRTYYRITKSFEYFIGALKWPIGTVLVPEGFVTDFATIPWPFSIFFKPDGKWAQAAVVHDYLYSEYRKAWLITRTRPFSRMVPDAIFYEGMRVLGINIVIATTFFLAVRLRTLFRKD